MSKVSALIQTVRSKAKRLSLSMMGTFAIAGANFLLSLMLIPVMEPRQYGFFTFGLIITQFSYSIVNAMGGTSLSIVLNRGTDDWQAEYSAIMKVNFLVAVLAGLAAAGSAVAFDMPLAVICFMGLFSFSAALRWSYRCAEFARQRLQTTAASDLIYAGVVAIGSVTIHFLHSDKTLVYASATVATAGLASCAYLFLDSRKTASGVKGRLSDYMPIWRTQARWALVGVATTEMTSNGHSYLVTLMAGPQAFAPIAVATMLWRPLTVVFPALMLVERPVMARHLANGDVAMARKTTSSFLRIVLTILVANLMLVLLLGLIFHEKVANLPYDPRNLYLAGTLWFVVIFMQSLRIPASSLVQAAGKFKPLANTSIVAAPVTMILAAAIIYFINPVASIVGIIAGEIVMTFLVYRLTRKDEMLR